jgi:hypothetical protein
VASKRGSGESSVAPARYVGAAEIAEGQLSYNRRGPARDRTFGLWLDISRWRR